MSEHDRPRRTWTPAEDAAVLRLAAEGVSARQTGVLLGRTMAAVHARLTYLRRLDEGLIGRRNTGQPVDRRPWSDDEVGQVHRLVRDGHDARSIAAAIGRSPSSVGRMLYSHGLRTVAKIDANAIDAILYRASQR